jgi:hypothetical protein
MRRRRIGCLVLAAFLALPLALPTVAHASNFYDVTGHWAEFYISKVYDENIIKGYPNGYFQPDQSVTRAEFAAMINKTFDLDKLGGDDSITYNDVPASAWYYNDVERAVIAGYAGGYSDNTFRPNNPITREEAAVMLDRMISAGKKNGAVKSFADAKSIDTWATASISKLNGKGYMGAYDDGKLHPTDPLTRAQTSKIISDILDNEDIVTSRTVVDKDGTTLSNKTYVGKVLIDEDLAEGSVTIDNCVIVGELIIEGGGNATVTINNTRVSSATVDKDKKPVRILTKGSTVIKKIDISQGCTLQPAGKGSYSFPDVTINRESEVTLKGTFPKVTIEGSKVSLTVASGQINYLDVTSSGKYSDIILSGKSIVSDAAINAECYFHGTGSISLMTVNADNVTYETKPDKMLVGLSSDRPESEGNDDISVAFKPKNKTDDVDIDTTITATFNTSVMLANGSAITGSNVASFLTLRPIALTGTAVACTATINNAKKVITLTPSAKLSEFTKYYIVLTGSAVKNIGDNLNDAEKSYFTTGGTTPKLNNYALTASATAITVSFTPNVTGAAYFIATTSSAIPTSSEIIAVNKSVTTTASTPGSITLSGLSEGTTYYVYGVLVGSNTAVSSIVSASATTPTSYAALSSLTLVASGGSNLLTGFSSTEKTYSVIVPLGTTTVDVSAGTNTTANTNAVIAINSTTGSSLAGIAVTSGTTTVITVTISADNKTSSTYTINVTVAAT